MKQRLAFLPIIAVVALALACGSMNRMTPKAFDDTAMKADVKGKIAELYPGKTFEIGVTVEQPGIVTLTGTVENREQVRAIGKAAGSVNGVKRVVNNIQVKM